MLTAKFVQHAPVGWHCDGRGLYLQVTEGANGAVRSWVYRYSGRYMGLGPLADVTLAMARDRAQAARRQRLDGVDPIDARNAQRATARLKDAKAMTFGQCVAAYLETHEAGWKSTVHRNQ